MKQISQASARQEDPTILYHLTRRSSLLQGVAVYVAKRTQGRGEDLPHPDRVWASTRLADPLKDQPNKMARGADLLDLLASPRVPYKHRGQGLIGNRAIRTPPRWHEGMCCHRRTHRLPIRRNFQKGLQAPPAFPAEVPSRTPADLYLRAVLPLLLHQIGYARR